MLPGISEDYAGKVLARLDDRPREVAEEHFVECLKFLVLASMGTSKRIALTPEVDSVWHELILQTAYYRELCALLPGGGFLDHETITPTLYARRVGDEEFVREFVQWVPDYVQNFGPFSPRSAELWTVARFLRDEMGLTGAELNEAGFAWEASGLLPPTSDWRRLGSITRISEAVEPRTQAVA